MFRTLFERQVPKTPPRAEPKTTVALSEVARGEIYYPLDVSTSVRNLLAKPVEAMGCTAQRLVSCDTTHALVKAAHDAFYDHQPLTIRPDDVWFCIAQGFATHVKRNVESLRSTFVAHGGKKKLVVEYESFFLRRNAPWPEVFSTFSAQIGEQVGRVKDLVSARFSTTTPIEAAAFDVCLMDTFQGYFEYEARLGCGIPEITVLGTPDDWRSMIPRVRRLSEYGLETWSAALVPVLEKIADTAAGKVDRDFWLSFFRYQSGSGRAELTGWIVTLFPYLVTNWQTRALGPNEYLPAWQAQFERARSRTNQFLDLSVELQGPLLAAVPEGLVSAPVHCVDVRTGKARDLRFVAGMFGVEQHPETQALAASFGWAIIEDKTR